jgi:hypothetical protein
MLSHRPVLRSRHSPRSVAPVIDLAIGAANPQSVAVRARDARRLLATHPLNSRTVMKTAEGHL